MTTPSASFPFDSPGLFLELPLRVRYAECDPMGFVHHSNYLTYMELGRIEALRTRGLAYRDLEEQGFLIVVSRLALRFRAPARQDDELLLQVGLARATRARLDHRYRLWRVEDRMLCLEGETTLACVTREGQLQALPEQVLATVDARVPGNRS